MSRVKYSRTDYAQSLLLHHDLNTILCLNIGLINVFCLVWSYVFTVLCFLRSYVFVVLSFLRYVAFCGLVFAVVLCLVRYYPSCDACYGFRSEAVLCLVRAYVWCGLMLGVVLCLFRLYVFHRVKCRYIYLRDRLLTLKIVIRGQ